MKDLVKKAQSFITFDAPFKIGSIKTLFAATHQKQQSIMPYWGITSTRQKLIAHYWYSQVPGHFALLLSLPILIFLLTSGGIEHGHILVVLIVIGLTFGVLWVCHYWPAFIGDFLPKLESVVHAHRQDQLAQVITFQQVKIAQQQQEVRRLTAAMIIQAEQQVKALEKCKKAQLSNLALVLIYHVFEKRKTALPDLPCTKETASLLMQFFGVDTGSIYENLKLTKGTSGSYKNMKPRRQTEIKNSFEEAYRFFEQMSFEEGTQLLKNLEMKITGH
jgi:hypothetical protein